MCHALLQDPAFFRFLQRIDEEFAAETRRGRCRRCAGALHSADYPRKPRGCPASVIEDYSSRDRAAAAEAAGTLRCGYCDGSDDAVAALRIVEQASDDQLTRRPLPTGRGSR